MVVTSDTKWPVQKYERATGKNQSPILMSGGPSMYITLQVFPFIPLGIKLLHNALADIYLEEVGVNNSISFCTL